MKLLPDTHLLLWAALGSARLSVEAEALLNDTDNELFFSAASIWEIAIKTGKGRADFQVDADQFRQGLASNGYREIPVTGDHGAGVSVLPMLHKDPFDRMLVAQAIAEGVVLLTADPVVASYPGPIRKV